MFFRPPRAKSRRERAQNERERALFACFSAKTRRLGSARFCPWFTPSLRARRYLPRGAERAVRMGAAKCLRLRRSLFAANGKKRLTRASGGNGTSALPFHALFSQCFSEFRILAFLRFCRMRQDHGRLLPPVVFLIIPLFASLRIMREFPRRRSSFSHAEAGEHVG